MPPKLFTWNLGGPNYMSNAWDRVMSGETPMGKSPTINFNVPTRSPSLAVAFAPAIPYVARMLPALTAAAGWTLAPSDVKDASINAANEYIINPISRGFTNMVRNGYYAPGVSLNSNEIYTRPVEVNDATYNSIGSIMFGRLRDAGKGAWRGITGKLNAESTTLPANRENTENTENESGTKPAEDKPTQESEKPRNKPNNSNNEDPDKKPFWKSKWGKAIKYGVIELGVGSIIDAMYQSSKKSRLEKDGYRYDGPDRPLKVIGLPWLTPLGATFNFKEALLDNDVQETKAAQDKEKQDKENQDTTTNKTEKVEQPLLTRGKNALDRWTSLQNRVDTVQ